MSDACSHHANEMPVAQYSTNIFAVRKCRAEHHWYAARFHPPSKFSPKNGVSPADRVRINCSIKRKMTITRVG